LLGVSVDFDGVSVLFLDLDGVLTEVPALTVVRRALGVPTLDESVALRGVSGVLVDGAAFAEVSVIFPAALVSLAVALAVGVFLD
jgi:hypothetical protein